MNRTLVLTISLYVLATILALVAMSMALSTLTTIADHFRLLP